MIVEYDNEQETKRLKRNVVDAEAVIVLYNSTIDDCSKGN